MKDLEKPLFIYDGDCAFCLHYMYKWKERVGESVRFEPYQKVHRDFPNISIDRFKKSSKLILPDGEVREGAKGIFTLFSYEEGRGKLLWWYMHIPFFGIVSEFIYFIISRNRPFFMMFIR